MNIRSLPGSIRWRPFQNNNLVIRQISFQNLGWWLGGRISNTPPSAIPGRYRPPEKTKRLQVAIFILAGQG